MRWVVTWRSQEKVMTNIYSQSSDFKVIKRKKTQIPACTFFIKTLNRYDCLEIDEIESNPTDSIPHSELNYIGEPSYSKKKNLNEQLLKVSFSKMKTKKYFDKKCKKERQN